MFKSCILCICKIWIWRWWLSPLVSSLSRFKLVQGDYVAFVLSTPRPCSSLYIFACSICMNVSYDIFSCFRLLVNEGARGPPFLETHWLYYVFETSHNFIACTFYCRYQIPEDWPYQEARHLFKEPNVIMDVPELKWTAPDEEVTNENNKGASDPYIRHLGTT